MAMEEEMKFYSSLALTGNRVSKPVKREATQKAIQSIDLI